MKEIWHKLIGSFDNAPGGFSGRKLCAFTVMCLVVWLHIKYREAIGNHIVEIIIVDFLFILLCLGLVTFEQIIKFKNGNKPEAPQ